jgi:hypothetical protein
MTTPTLPPGFSPFFQFAPLVPRDKEDDRPGISLKSASEKLGPLADLAGTWIGSGFNLVSLPAHEQKREFSLRLDTTVEVLEFEPIGAQVPNRGSYSGVPKPSGQGDIDIYGLRYLQRVANARDYKPLHIEPGFWLNVPATQWPELSASVVRQAVIPHGNSLLALGAAAQSTDRPKFDQISSIPRKHDGTDFANPSYTKAFRVPPKGFDKDLVANPNLALDAAIENQTITKTVTLIVSAENPKKPTEDPEGRKGRIANIPFIVKNADVTKFDAIFWIETVQNRDGSTFLQLQYTQTAILDFLDIDWPHISVATLIKQ